MIVAVVVMVGTGFGGDSEVGALFTKLHEVKMSIADDEATKIARVKLIFFIVLLNERVHI